MTQDIGAVSFLAGYQSAFSWNYFLYCSLHPQKNHVVQYDCTFPAKMYFEFKYLSLETAS